MEGPKKTVITFKRRVKQPDPTPVEATQPTEPLPMGCPSIQQPDKYQRLNGGRAIKTIKDYRYLVCQHNMVCGLYEEMTAFCQANRSMVFQPYRYQDELPSINDPYNLKGYTCAAKVLRVIDGDTYDLSLQVNLRWLMDTSKASFNFTVSDDLCMGITLNCRLFGVDCAEKNTSCGKEIKEWVIQQFQALENKVWVQLLHYDRIGRMLVNVFLDEQLKDNLTHKILTTFTREYAYEYYGGTKEVIGEPK